MGRPGAKAERLQSSLDNETLDSLERQLGAHTPSSSPEEHYIAHVPFAHRRRYAQFFTPPAVAELMARWIAECAPKTVLDPAIGTGILARSVMRSSPASRVVGYDIDPLVLSVAARSLGPKRRHELRQRDFLTGDLDDRFDAVIANPPYLRHHDMLDGAQAIHAVGKRSGLVLSRLTNSYALFLLEACRRLNPGGRAAFLIPSEWTNANFGAAIKRYLLRMPLLRRLIYIGNGTNLFGDSLTTASILFLENAAGAKTVRTLYVPSEPAFPRFADLDDEAKLRARGATPHEFGLSELLDEPKWDDLIRRGLRSLPAGFVPLRELATTKRGVATGANEFFHISEPAARARDLPEEILLPCAGRAADVAGYIFSPEDFLRLKRDGKRAYLLKFGDRLSSPEREYVAEGEAKRLHERYLTKQRRPWHAMENATVAPIWAAVFGRNHMRFIFNAAAVYNLTTFHGIFPFDRDPIHVQALTALLNSRAIQDIMRRQLRVYGGGLLKMEPRDLLDIQLPDIRLCKRETLAELAQALADLHGGKAADDVLDAIARRAMSEAAGVAG